MRRKQIVALITAILTFVMVSGALAQSDWWLKGTGKGDKKNVPSNVKAGDVIVFGKFNNASLEWQVLDKKVTKALLFCTKCLATEPYNPVRSKFITWEDCRLREWLNELYLSDAFSKSQRKRIQLTVVDNSSGQHRKVYGKIKGQADTKDHIYLLSWQEVAAYFPSTKSRIRERSWWTRSPGETDGTALSVANDGKMTGGNDVSSNQNGVYPVLWLELE